jgi:hypothetical protein
VAGHVFVSYSHADDAYVRRLVAHFETEGFEVWSDDGIDVGAQWISVVRGMVDSCAAFVLVMSPDAEASTWVARELERAEAKDKPVLPLLLRGGLFGSLPMIQYESVAGEELPSHRFLNRLRALAPTTKPPVAPAPASVTSAPTPSAPAATPPLAAAPVAPPATALPPTASPTPPAAAPAEVRAAAAPVGSLVTAPALPPAGPWPEPRSRSGGSSMLGRRVFEWALLALILTNVVLVQSQLELEVTGFTAFAIRVDWLSSAAAAVVLIVGALRASTLAFPVRAMAVMLMLGWLYWLVFLQYGSSDSLPSWLGVLVTDVLPIYGCAAGLVAVFLLHRARSRRRPGPEPARPPRSAATVTVQALGVLALVPLALLVLAGGADNYAWAYPPTVAVFGAIVIQTPLEPDRGLRRLAATGTLTFAVLQIVGLSAWGGPFDIDVPADVQLILAASQFACVALAAAAITLLTQRRPTA